MNKLVNIAINSVPAFFILSEMQAQAIPPVLKDAIITIVALAVSTLGNWFVGWLKSKLGAKK